MTFRVLFTVMLLGFSLSAPQAKAEVATMDPENAWTEADVKTFCKSRFNHQPISFNDCIKRNMRKVGREKSPGDLQELGANPALPAAPAIPNPAVSNSAVKH